MAFKVNSEAQAMFFSTVFGPGHAVTTKVKSLIASGVAFEVGLYELVAKGKASAVVSLTTGTTALMKGLASEPVLAQNKALIEAWVGELFAKVAPVPVSHGDLTILGVDVTKPNTVNLIVLIKAIRTVTGMQLAGAKALAQQVLNGTSVSVGVVGQTLNTAAKTLLDAGVLLSAETILAATKAKTLLDAGVQLAAEAKPSQPVDAVIKLKDAKALGQKVHGTSPGSVYHTIALTDHLRLAARVYKTGAISIRAEWTDSPKEDLKKLQESGVLMKSGYGSIHFDAAGVPVERVVGAFLIGTGVNWTSAVMNAAQLVLS